MAYCDAICQIITRNLPEINPPNATHIGPLSKEDWEVLRKTYQHKGVDALRRTVELIELLGLLRKKELYPEFAPQMVYTDDVVVFWWRRAVLHLLHELDETDPQIYIVQTFPSEHTQANAWEYDTALEAIQQLRSILIKLYPQTLNH